MLFLWTVLYNSDHRQREAVTTSQLGLVSAFVQRTFFCAVAPRWARSAPNRAYRVNWSSFYRPDTLYVTQKHFQRTEGSSDANHALYVIACRSPAWLVSEGSLYRYLLSDASEAVNWRSCDCVWVNLLYIHIIYYKGAVLRDEYITFVIKLSLPFY